jgi:phosphoglucomutase
LGGRRCVRVLCGRSSTDALPLQIAWLNIIAAANEQDKSGKLWGIREILNKHYAKYGRSFFSRYDYEEVPSEGAQKLVDHVNQLIKSSSFSGKSYTSSATGTSFTVAKAYNFDYTDPIDKSVSKNQGQVVTFSDGSRVVWRLSGTGSQGATVRMYVERYVAADAGERELSRDTGEGLQALIDVALEISNLKQFLGREQPTVITVSITYLSRTVKRAEGMLGFSERDLNTEDRIRWKSDGMGER